MNELGERCEDRTCDEFLVDVRRVGALVRSLKIRVVDQLTSSSNLFLCLPPLTYYLFLAISFNVVRVKKEVQGVRCTSDFNASIWVHRGNRGAGSAIGVNRVAVERSTVGRDEETLVEVVVEDVVLTLADVGEGRWDHG